MLPMINPKLHAYANAVGINLIGPEGEIGGAGKWLSALREQLLPPATADGLRKLLFPLVPNHANPGSCSTTNELAPFSLARQLGLTVDQTEPLDRPHVVGHPQVRRIRQLDRLMRRLYDRIRCDWVGVYRCTTIDGTVALLKEAYVGKESRAVFPLTEDFALQSTNVTVALSGRARVVADVLADDGPYYSCDSRVRSEACLPILDLNGGVIGIIDAESFQVGHFTGPRVAELAATCVELGGRHPFLSGV